MTTADKVRAFDIGAEDYMGKPFVAPELLARVSTALGRQAREFSATTIRRSPPPNAAARRGATPPSRRAART